MILILVMLIFKAILLNLISSKMNLNKKQPYFYAIQGRFYGYNKNMGYTVFSRSFI